LAPDVCTPDTSFLGVVATEALSGLRADGIMGLAPNNQGTSAEMIFD